MMFVCFDNISLTQFIYFPGVINRQGVLTQLRCSGMLEALRIMQAGFPTRCLFTDLYARYKGLF